MSDAPLKCAVIPVTPFQQNCSLIFDEDTKIGAVVDPGGDLPEIEAAIILNQAVYQHRVRPELYNVRTIDHDTAP